MNNPILTINKLSHNYRKEWALQDIELQIENGRITCLLGPNGAGKSTLVHCLVGMLKPTKGSVRIAGLSVEQAAKRSLIGFVFDDLPLPASLSGLEMLQLLAASHSHWDNDLANDLVDLLDMRSALSTRIEDYSHGMKKRLQLISSLGQRPRLWILDEPFNGLDPLATSVLIALVRKFVASGGTAIVATHDLLAAQQLADNIVVISRGGIACSGALEVLLDAANGDLRKLYLDATGLSAHVEEACKRLETMNFSSSWRVIG